MNKSQLREHYLAQRQSLSQRDMLVRSSAICQHLAKFCQNETYSQICLYSATRNEPSLSELRDLLKRKHTFALPVTHKERNMNFWRWDAATVLKCNRFGIFEPEISTSNIIQMNEHTLLLVPVIAIDKMGYRLGFGGGFYDKFLANHKNLTTVAIAFAEFFVDELPRDEWDQAMQWICTEKGITRAKS